MNALEYAHRYNNFQKNIGQFLDENINQTIEELFTDSFQKIANGTVLVPNRNALKEQIFACRDQAGRWSIDVKEVSLFQDAKRCLIRYLLHSEKLGVFDVMATLEINDYGRINAVDEVYYQPSA